jgi:arginyl-tRNA synthetase
MSTRKGNVVMLNDMLKEAKENMHEIMRKNQEKYAQIQDPEGTADIVGKAAIMIQDMSAKR